LIERLGKYNRTLAAGVHVIIPFFDRVAHKESILERQLPAKTVPAFTKNYVKISITLAILYRVTDASKAWYRIKNIDQAIETIITGFVRSTIGASDLDQVQSNRSELSSAIGNRRGGGPCSRRCSRSPDGQVRAEPAGGEQVVFDYRNRASTLSKACRTRAVRLPVMAMETTSSSRSLAHLAQFRGNSFNTIAGH